MVRDPIVEKVRAAREDFARRHNYDIDAIVRALQEASEREGRQLVSFPPRPVADEDKRREAS
jgi:hypothetical protein